MCIRVPLSLNLFHVLYKESASQRLLGTLGVYKYVYLTRSIIFTFLIQKKYVHPIREYL